jgi:transposase
MAKQQRYSPEVRERAVRLLREQRANYETEWAAISSIASNLGGPRKAFASGCVA